MHSDLTSGFSRLWKQLIMNRRRDLLIRKLISSDSCKHSFKTSAKKAGNFSGDCSKAPNSINQARCYDTIGSKWKY